ncbi:tautomerase family protein [Pseudodonghicola flavimaris]|uniref:5-carboxymethyl-2-hydroxymuconate isomerase n=1 Tax=Pseudodonghicola flavimaris TaxID=3050036 RepID=A0ABT7EWP8_9RHOB|nr:hypothetical protein [Pseudodonghicola flavimaris]MDK3016761.1 hypothetical protein [Pseudodonghicola flavimaris]
MPHFILEQGNALTTPEARTDAMRIAGEVGGACDFIEASDIKLRICDTADFLMLDGRQSYLHLTAKLLSGRTPEQKEQLAIGLRAALAERFPEIDSISIDVVDMDPFPYKKHLRAL